MHLHFHNFSHRLPAMPSTSVTSLSPLKFLLIIFNWCHKTFKAKFSLIGQTQSNTKSDAPEVSEIIELKLFMVLRE